VSTEVVLTGTGVPHPRPGCAGAGTLVRHGDVALQFDAGRATVLRLTEAGTPPSALTALFLTHVHSDHVVGLADLVMTGWTERQVAATGPLPLFAPEGAPTRFAQRMLEPYAEDLALRLEHIGGDPVEVAISPFVVSHEPVLVWTSADGSVRVRAVGVHHEPVREAVAYRVETPDGVVVVSGDTRVCGEVEDLAAGADVLVHEACRTSALSTVIAGTVFEKIFEYHADTMALGALAERAGARHLVLTHLIPPLDRPGDADAFAADVREGGYTGRVTVGTDLTRVTL
jgi:ribonuclease Z